MQSILMPLYVNFPKWISAQIFPTIPVLNLIRWYGLMYVFAFGTAYFLLKKEVKDGLLDSNDYKATEDDMFSFLACGILFLLLGARIFATLVYDTTDTYLKKPWLIFWPFDTKTGKFTGLAGMSYHGGFIGGFLGMLFWCLKHKKPALKWMDAMALAIPLGYTFGRLGNFMNGELYGRVTTVPWGMIFPRAERFPVSEGWVQETMQAIGMDGFTGQKFVNLPRHPSQLYEALFEGVLLWAIMWPFRKKKPFDGFFAACYTLDYGVVRFIIEYFREPDAGLGFRISPTGDQSIYLYNSLLNISTGQILCFLMILGSIAFIAVGLIQKKKKSQPEEKK